MKLITFFETMTRAKIKDCISNEKIIFIVEENEMGKAIGKNGINIKKMEKILKKRIKLIEYSSDILQFIKNIIYPIEVQDIKRENSIITIYGQDAITKAMLIGRDRQNINHIYNIVKRYFDIKEIKVV
jgi:N utilization substance protein A